MFYNYASSLSYARYVAEDIKMNSLRSEIMRLSAKIEIMKYERRMEDAEISRELEGG